MRLFTGSLIVLFALILPPLCLGQSQSTGIIASSAPPDTPAPLPTPLGPDYYFSSIQAMQQAILLLPLPPTPNSATQAANVQTLNTIAGTASTQMVNQAEATANYSVFDFSQVLGPGFNAQNLPLVNQLFNNVTINTADAASDLKAFYNSPGPQMPETYPSTQTMLGVVEGTLLSDMLPQKQGQLQAFGFQEGLNRLILYAHWPTDVSSGMMLGGILVNDLFASPQFVSDFNAAKSELIAQQSKQ